MQAVRENEGLCDYSKGSSYHVEGVPLPKDVLQHLNEIVDHTTSPITPRIISQFVHLHRLVYPMFQEMSKKLSVFFDNKSEAYGELYEEMKVIFDTRVGDVLQACELEAEEVCAEMKRHVRDGLLDITRYRIEGQENVRSLFPKKS